MTTNTATSLTSCVFLHFHYVAKYMLTCLVFNYNSNGSLANVTDAFGRTVYFTLTNGLITQITDSIGIVATYDYYAGTSNLKTVTYPDGSKYQLNTQYLAVKPF